MASYRILASRISGAPGSTLAGNVTIGTAVSRITSDGFTEIFVPYTAPAGDANFAGVAAYWEDTDQSSLPAVYADGSFDADGSGGAGGEWNPEAYTRQVYEAGKPVVIRLREKVTAARDVRVYLNSYNHDGVENELRRASDASPTPSVVVTVSPISLGPIGEEYCKNPESPSVTSNAVAFEGGVRVRRIKHAWTRPEGCSGAYVEVLYRDPDGNEVINVAVCSGSEGENWFPEPKTVQTAVIRWRGYVDQFPGVEDDLVNTYSKLVTPEAEISIGTATGTVDLGEGITDTVTAAMTVVNKVLGVAPSGITTDLIAVFAVSQERLANAQIIDAARIVDDAVINSKIGDLAVNTAELAAAAVSTAKLQDLAVEAAKLAALSVESGKLVDGAVITAKLADLGITSGKLVDAAVIEAKLAAAAVTETKVASLAISQAKVQDAAIGTAQIIDLAVSTAKVNDLAVTTAKVNSLAVTTAKIAALAVGEAQIADAAVATAKIQDASISSAKIQTLAVGAAAIAAAAVGTAKIEDLAVTTAKIDSLAVTNAKVAALAVASANIQNTAIGTAQIADLAVTTAKINNLAVTNGLIADLAVSTAKIQDLAVTSAKIASLEAGKITAGTISASVSMTSPTLQISTGSFIVNIDNSNAVKVSGVGTGNYCQVNPGSFFAFSGVGPYCSYGSQQIQFWNGSTFSTISPSGINLQGFQVVGTRLSSVSTVSYGVGPFPADTFTTGDRAVLNALITAVNTIISRMQTHGLIS